MPGSDDEIPPPLPPPQTPTQQAPHTVSTIKLHILKKGEYDIWAMKMEHYLSHTDYPIWEVIQKGNGPVSISTDTNGVIKVLPLKTAKEIFARERERKARTTLLMALPKDHLAKFHQMTDAKDMWDAIKSRFCGNDESKKMQKYILKQQFEGFSVSNLEGLHKGYDRYLPSSWSQVSLVMRTKPGVDSLRIDDLYNNLRVFESDIKGFTGSSSSALNVAFVSSESTSSTNDVSTAYGVSTSSGYNSQRENSSSYTDELMYSLFANQSSGLHLDHEDLEQLDEFDLEEMDLKWQVAMISMRLKTFYKKTGRKLHFDAKEPVVFDKTKIECYNCHKKEHFARVEQLGDASIEIQAYTQALKKVEAQLVVYQKNQLWYEEKISFMKVDLDDKTDVLTYHKKLLAEAEKEKEELKTKLENFQSSSKGLILQSVFDSRSSDVEDSPVHDRFANVEGMHAIPPPMTGNYMPLGPDRKVDDSMFTYGPKQSKTSESVKPNVVSQPKVWPDAPIIEEYESDSDSDEYVIKPSKEHEKPSFDFVNTLDKKDWNGLLSKRLGLGYGFTRKACLPFNRTTSPKANFTNHKVNAVGDKIVSAVGGNRETAVKAKAGGFLQKAFNEQRKKFFDRSKGQITGKGKIITGKLDFEDVYFVKELKQFNLFSVSQMCDKKNKVLFTDSECLVLSPDFKLPDENQNSRIGTVLNYVGSKRDQEGEYRKGPNWLFDLDYLTDSMNYQPVTVENKANKTTGPKEANHSAGTQDNIDAGNSKMEAEPAQEYFVLPLWSSYTSTVKSSEAKNGGEKPNGDTGSKTNEEPVDQEDQAFLEELERLKRQEKEANDAAEAFRKEFAQCTEDLLLQAGAARATSTNIVNTVSTPISTASPLEFSVMVRPSLPVQPTMTKCRFSKPSLMDIYAIYSNGILPMHLMMMRIEPKKISQTLEDENPEFPKKVTKSGYRRGTIDKTLFIKKDKNDIMLVQVYVDDIIFCSTKKSWCVNFGWHVGARKMDGAGTGIDDEKFPVSSMGELTFSFLGLQVQLQIPSLASNCFLFFGLVIVDGSLDTSKLNPNLAFGILECHHLTWKPILTVTILEQILIGNPQQEVVNFLAGDLSHV
ncbi:hypothetical protein Tco_0724645 [Tanacetum coccineum]